MKNIFFITLFYLLFTLFLHGQGICPNGIIIPTGQLGSASNTSQNLKQSRGWIKTTTSTIYTTSLSNVVVELYPRFTSYVELNPGFVATPDYDGAFIAQPMNVCEPLAPARTIENSKEMEEVNDAFVQSVTISPNPSNEIFNIKIDNIADGNIEVYTIIGVLLLEKSFEKNAVTQINLERFPAQTYIVKIKSRDSTFVASRQIIKY